MKVYAYLFEAKGIGRYITASGRLRDMIGASELVARLTDGSESLIRRTVQKLDLESSVRYSRCAGGAFCLHADEKEPLEQIASAFRLIVMATRPGLEIGDSWGEGEAGDRGRADMDALENAYKNMSGIRENSLAEILPVAGPLASFAEQTGLPATKVFTYPDKKRKEAETFRADFVTEPQRALADSLSKKRALDAVAGKFIGSAGPPPGKTWKFPRNMEAAPDTRRNPSFPFTDERRRVAVIHADLSGLGEIFRNATAQLGAPADMLVLSEAIETLIGGSVEAAGQCIRDAGVSAEAADGRHADLAVLPARPILLGGDDITIIVRPDLAFEFAESLLREIRNRSEATLKELADCDRFKGLHFPKYLSACAGLAIVRQGQPMSFALALADDLCGFAKKAAKAGLSAPYPGALAFHVTSTTLQEDYRAIRTANLMSENGGRVLTANPYFVTDGDSSQSFSALLDVARALSRTSGAKGLNAFRQKLIEDDAQAIPDWQVWRRRYSRAASGAIGALDAALRAAGVADPDRDPFNGAGRTMLFDALELLDLGAVASSPAAAGPQTPALAEGAASK